MESKYINTQDSLVSAWGKVKINCEDKIAVVDNSKQLTFKMLDLESDNLAAFIISLDCKLENRISVFMERSVKYIVAFLGVLKAGGCIVPIDIDTPTERISFILEDSNSKVLLTDSLAMEKLKNISFKCKVYQIDNNKEYQGIKLSNIYVDPCNLAYILYTSGTSGNPKGIMVEHRNVVNLITWFIKQYNKHLRHCILLASIGFDVSVEEILGSLLSGSTLYIPHKNVKTNKKLFKQYIDENKISIIQTIPKMLKELFVENEFMATVEVIISGSDILNEDIKHNVLDMGYELYNHYGPTETTVDATFCKCRYNTTLSIGKPIDNVEIFIVNNGLLVNNGEIGEIYISGSGVSRGYVDSLLTEINFISDNNICAGKIYKTGDMGRVNEENEIVFCGRIDKQIKTNGIRLELYEIEKLFLKIDGVKEVVVTSINISNIDSKTCVYYLGEKNENDIRRELAKKIPSYEIPTYIRKLDHFNYNLNEKLSFNNFENVLYGRNYDMRVDKEGEKILELLSGCSEILIGELLKILDVPLTLTGIDSFVFMHLIVELEREFGISFNEEEMMLDYYGSLDHFIIYVQGKIIANDDNTMI